MKTYAKKVITNPLFSGSAIMVFGSNLANFFAYLYHFVIGRLLPPIEYGEVGAILSLLGLLSVLVSFLGLVIVKFVSASKKKELEGVFAWFYKLGFKFGLAVAVLIVILSPLISRFLHIDIPIIILLGPVFLVSTLNFLLRSFLQGLLRFKNMIISVNVEISLRLLLGAILVLLGFSVFGAIAGYFAASLVNFFLLRSFIKEFRTKKINSFFDKHKDVFSYAIPIFISSFFSYALISLDVILVKHYFPGSESGAYTALSTLGRIIFFAVAPISSVMFPIISKRNAEGKEYRSIFRLSIFLSGSAVSAVLLIYYLLPDVVVGVLYGFGKYKEIYSLLPIAGLFMAFYTLSTQIVNYYLSLEMTRIVVLFPIALITQIVGFVLFHDSLHTMLLVSTVSTGALFVTLLGRLIYDKKI
jgi:O-antigen/teichoic acid export membrane protein